MDKIIFRTDGYGVSVFMEADSDVRGSGDSLILAIGRMVRLHLDYFGIDGCQDQEAFANTDVMEPANEHIKRGYQ